MSVLAALLLAGALAAPAPAPPAKTLYRIDLAGNQTIWSEDRPKESSGAFLFHRYPGGALMSVRRSDVLRIVASDIRPTPARAISPGEEIEIGSNWGTGRAASAMPGAAPPRPDGSGPPRPGETKDGTALFNPDRPYRPDWDSKQVPGANLPFPSFANQYREGATLAYPPASATQSAPGAPPMMAPGSGEVPKLPN